MPTNPTTVEPIIGERFIQIVLPNSYVRRDIVGSKILRDGMAKDWMIANQKTFIDVVALGNIDYVADGETRSAFQRDETVFRYDFVDALTEETPRPETSSPTLSTASGLRMKT
jgi:hypothetical protein